MPYLRITCPKLSRETMRDVAGRLTEEINGLFFREHVPITREQLRGRTTVHFTPYNDEEMFIGGHTPQDRGRRDVTAELSDWSMSKKQQRRAAKRLAVVLAELFDVPESEADGINIRFHPYPPKDFAVGGRLLSDMVPLVGRIMKRCF